MPGFEDGFLTERDRVSVCTLLRSQKRRNISRHDPRATGTAITDHAPPEERAQSKRSVDIGRPRFGGRGPARGLRSALAGAALS